MKKILNFVEKKYILIIILFFIALLLLGLFTYRDYGISWDEHLSRTKGFVSLKYVLEGDPELFTSPGRYYGPFFDMLLAAVEKYADITTLREVSFIRHLINFLLFYISVIFFYLIANRKFNNWKLGLLGALFLILSPRIFAHSFFNPKDLPFMSLFIISVYTLILFLEKNTFLMVVLHALSCAILIDIRVLGIIVPLITFIFLISDMFIKKEIRSKGKKRIAVILTYFAATALLTILFWPLLWKDPVNQFIEAIKQMSRYPWGGYILYLGQFIRATDIPWHYVPVWILITTPILYITGFLFGCFAILKGFFQSPINYYKNNSSRLLFLVWFFLPLFTVIILRSVLYDGWRQMYFIYPAFLLIAIQGIIFVYDSIKNGKFKIIRNIYLKFIFTAIIILGLLYPIYFMIKYHPYQNIYFNKLAGWNMQEVKQNFELDYWGLTYREGLEYIMKNDDREVIKIAVADNPGKQNANILIGRHRGRIKYVDHPDYADYFISNYRYHRTEYLYGDEYYSIKIGNAKVLVIYKL